MFGGILLKHSVKHAAGLAAVAASSWTSRDVSGACVLMYHRVAAPSVFDLLVDDWNTTPSYLENQLRWLSQYADCVRLGDVFQPRGSGGHSKPLVALTFDDGFANFRHAVLPLLERYRIPATLFVATRYIGSEDPYPFDRWGLKNRSRVPSMAWRPITWAEIEECLHSGLVAIGSHSHSHFNAINVGAEQLVEEAVVSRDCLNSHVGAAHLSFYAYPYGASKLGQVTPAYIDAVRNAGFRMAVTTDLGMVGPTTLPFQIPRVEVHTYDSSRILQAKVLGHLWPQSLCDRLRQARR